MEAWYVILGSLFIIGIISNNIRKRKREAKWSETEEPLCQNQTMGKSEDNKNFVKVVRSDWAFRKFCLLLDVMMPLRYRYKADKLLVTRAILDQKANIEKFMGSELEIVEDEDSSFVFNHGHFLEVEEPLHISYWGNCPF